MNAGSTGSEPFYPRQVYMDAVVMFGVFQDLYLGCPGRISWPTKADPSDHSFVPA